MNTTNMDRRQFLKTSAMAAGAMMAGVGHTASKTDEIWACLLHLGMNSWKDVPLDRAPADASRSFKVRCMADYLRTDEAVWRSLTDRLGKSGANMIIIDMAEGVALPSHPELAVKGTWSIEKFQKELARLRAMGLEPIPKMNFSACHDSWLKIYQRMVSTKKYYEVCADVIRDTAEVFAPAKDFHIGFDEEDMPNYQRNSSLLVMRQGDLWWNDLNWFVREVEKYGARAWVWSDYIRRHPLEEFCRKMPKTVVQNPWTYRATKAKMAADPLIKIYSTLAEAGYDVAPCGSNCYGVTENFPEMSVYCKATLPAERFKGMIMAPWIKTIAPYRRLHWQAADLMAEAIQRTGL